METKCKILGREARKNAWSYYEKTYGDRLNAILQKIEDDSKVGIVAIEESIPMESVPFFESELGIREFHVRWSHVIPETEGEPIQDVILMISW